MQSTHTANAEDGEISDKQNLAIMIGGILGGLIFFAIVVVVVLAVSCSKKRKR